MNQNCIDVFKAYDLPFECYFNACTDHETVVHDEIEFIWLLEGRATIWCEGHTYELTPDSVFIFYVHQSHSMKSDELTFSVSFRFKKDYLKSLHLYFERLPFRNRVFTFDELAAKYPEVPLIMSQLITLMKSPDSIVNTRYQLMGYFNMYLFDLYSVRLKEKYLDIKKKNYDTYLLRFQKISAYVDAHYAERISLEALAGAVDISPSRLSHFIKEILGISFQEYLSKVRLEKAVSALRHTDMPIKDVVISCGFSDQKYLNALMKDLFHLTAHQYRKIMKDDLQMGAGDFSYPDMLLEFTRKLHRLKNHNEDPLHERKIMEVFRPAEKRDARTLSMTREMVWSETYRGIYPDELLERFDHDLHEARFRKQIEDPETQVYIIELEEKPIGYFSFGKPKDKVMENYGLCLHSLYVRTAYQNLGIGSRVFSFIRNYCLEKSIRRFTNSCNTHNIKARDFYLHMGGKPVHEDSGHAEYIEDQIFFEYRI